MARTWLITGTSSGLGRLLTEGLLERGDRVVATLRRPGALDALAARHGDRLQIFTLDVTDTPAIGEAVAAAFARMGRIDVVVSNAGYGLFGAGEEVSNAQIEQQIATNLTGSIQLIRAVLPYLRRQRGGRIVQVSSEGGQIAYPGFSVYHAAKWGIEGFIEAVAQEVAPFGIDFIIAEPGATATRFGANLVSPERMDIYDGTPAGAIRRMVEEGRFELRGDAGRTVDAMMAAADSDRPPLRLPLGSSAYENLTRELAKRLAAVKAQREIAYSADRDP